ncbi:MAG TPA: hypothetical protein V6D20_01175 [Candidatus Obscuribacterales bacterium]
MKATSLLCSAIAIGALTTANAESTTPVGYVSQDLGQGFNLVGLTLHPTPAAQGVLENVAAGATGSDLTDNELSITPEAGRTYILEITDASDPALIGTIQVIADTDISGTVITTPDELHTLGLASGDSYKLRLAPTLEEIFTTNSLGSGGVLQAGLASTVADLVWVPTAPGVYNKYYLNVSFSEFRDASTNTASPNVPIVYADGIFIQKRQSTAATLTLTGEVKTVGTITVLGQGFNVVSRVAPAGLNLFNAGLEDDVQAGLAPTVADLVWVQQGDLTYKKYFKSAVSGNWRDADNSTVDLSQAEAEAVELTSAILIQKRGADDSELDLKVPDSYTGL